MVSVLDRKVWRDLWSLRGQVLTIALLLASATTVLVGAVGTYTSLRKSQDRYYHASRFADLWAEVERAPRSLLGRLSEVPGVGTIEPRVVKDVRIEWPASDVSISGRIISIPTRSDPSLNRLSLVLGSAINPQSRDEVLVSAAFAESWGIKPGDSIRVILNGRVQSFRIVGLAQSPEYVYATRPGNPLPDDRTFVVLWAGEDAVASAFEMEGAFNSLAISTAPGAILPQVIADLDRLLETYGSRGAYDRTDQPSNRFLSDELAEQRTLALAVPVVFFAIAIFLLNVVVGRLVQAQREQIASLKALGLASLPIGLHYLKFVGLICLFGTSAGIALGFWYTGGMLEAYRPFFRFPELIYYIPFWVPMAGILFSALAAGSGALASVRQVVQLRPAEAMRPAAPKGANRLFGSGLRGRSKMVLRGMLARRLRTLVGVLSLAFAVPMLVMGLFWWDALAYMIDAQFDRIERADAVVSLTDARSGRAVHELASIPGVLAAEGQRAIAVRLRAANRMFRLPLTGLSEGATLRVPRRADLSPAVIPENGLLLTTGLADRLAVRAGDPVTVEVLEGKRPRLTVDVSGIVDEVLGYNAYMDLDATHRLMREDDVVSQVSIKVDPALASDVWRHISERPRVAAISVKSVWLKIFEEKIAGIVIIAAIVLSAFGLIIAIGVVYNGARIGLQERSWELASLRVLGFTRGEVSSILLIELALQTLVAIPIGLISAQWIITLLLSFRDNESFRIPAVISTATFCTAALIVAGAAVASGIQIHRRVDRLDLVAVLKTRD